MPEVEDGSPLVGDDPSQRCSKALRTILHGVLATTFFSVIMFTYIYLYRYSSYDVASLVIQLIAYLALGYLYICNSSGWQDKVISAGFLVFVQLVFLVCSIGIPDNSLRVDQYRGYILVLRLEVSSLHYPALLLAEKDCENRLTWCNRGNPIVCDHNYQCSSRLQRHCSMASRSISILQRRWLPTCLQRLWSEGEGYLHWISYNCSPCLPPILV
jgi:hypothetical protein